jgi:chorismate dehydratase
MLRFGCVPYLNGRPLVEGLEGVVFRTPLELTELLERGDLDAATVPVAEVLRRGWAHVPGIAIASPGKTDSVRLHHKVEVPDIRRVALDANSRTSNLLARVILERRYGLRPAYVVRDPSRGASLRGVDAAVTIGDASFLPSKVPFLDLGTEWKAFTGRPMVYALWAHRRGHPRAREMARALRAARDRGLSRLGAIARREARRLGLTPRFCRAYLAECMVYSLGPAERAGLRLYAKHVREYL